MNDNVNNAVENFRSIVTETDRILMEWNDGNLLFPDLLNLVGKKLNITGDELKTIDPFIRYYVRKHPDFHASRGAKGGIESMKIYQARVQAKEEKKLAKQAVVKQIDARLSTEDVIEATGTE